MWTNLKSLLKFFTMPFLFYGGFFSGFFFLVVRHAGSRSLLLNEMVGWHHGLDGHKSE